MSVRKTTTFYLDSRNRTSGTISNWSVDIPPMVAKANTRFRLRILDVVIPFTFQQLTSSFNTITYTITIGSGSPVSGTATISIPPGNYTILSLLQTIQSKLIASIHALMGVVVPFVMTFDNDTLHCTFGIDNPYSPMTMTWTNAELNQMMGFGATVFFSDTAPATSTQPVNVNPARSLYLRTNSINTNTYENIVGAPVSSSNILLKIPLTVGNGSYIRYENKFDVMTEITNTTIDKLSFFLTDIFNNDIILALDWSISLVIEEYEVKIDIEGTQVLDFHQLEEEKRMEEIQRLEKEKQKLLDEAQTLMHRGQRGSGGAGAPRGGRDNVPALSAPYGKY